MCDEGLLDRWLDAVRAAGGADPGGTAGGELLARWAEPHRTYHDLAHLDAVLTVVDEHAASATDADAVRLAAWFHDAIYDPRAVGEDNERASAALAERALTGLSLPPDTVAEVVRLVLVTAGHQAPPADRNGALLCDADLAVLAREPADYDRYAAAIRAEYAHVPDGPFRAGRAAVLRRLLELPMLYRTPALASAWEGRAGANLGRELATLAP